MTAIGSFFIFTLAVSGAASAEPAAAGKIAAAPDAAAVSPAKPAPAAHAGSEGLQSRPSPSSSPSSSNDITLLYEAQGKALEEAGKRNEAGEQYRLAYLYATSPADKERLLLLRAQTYERMEWYSEAALCLESLLKTFPQTPAAEQIRLTLARYRMKLGQPLEALRQYNRAGSSLPALFGKADALQALERHQEAHVLYLDLIKRDDKYLSSSAETRLSAGENFRIMGKREDARVYLASVQEPALKYAAELGLGLLDLEEGKVDQGVRRLLEVSERGDRKTRTRAFSALAGAYLRTGRTDDAVASLVKMKSFLPQGKEYDEGTLMLARIRRSQGMRDEAIALLKELLFRRSPDSRAIDELEAILHETMTKDSAAFSRYWKACGQWLLDPSRMNSLLAFAAGLKQHPKSFLTLCKWLLKYGGEKEKSGVRLLLAGFYAGLGDVASAQNYLRRLSGGAAALGDGYLRTLAKVLLLEKQDREAAATIISMRQPEREDALRLLPIIPALDQPDQAIDFCDKTFQSAGASTAALAAFADILYATGRPAEARRYYETIVSLETATSGAPARSDAEWSRYRLTILSPEAAQQGDSKEAVRAQTAAGRLLDADRKGLLIAEKVRQAF